MSTHLWNYLGEMTPVSHQRSVDLLYQLHQLAPTPWVCEDVIGNALLSDNKVSSPAIPHPGDIDSGVGGGGVIGGGGHLSHIIMSDSAPCGLCVFKAKKRNSLKKGGSGRKFDLLTYHIKMY